MSIKRRIFISTIVTLTILFLVGATLALSAKYFVFETRETQKGFYLNDPVFFENRLREVSNIIEAWREKPDPAVWLAEAEAFNNNLGDRNMALMIFRNGTALTGTHVQIEPAILNLVLSSPDGDHLAGFDQVIIYATDIDGYKILLADSNFINPNFILSHIKSFGGRFYYLFLAGTFIFMLTMVLSSMFLRKFIFKPIVASIDALSFGVHQIRDGNLDYRISDGQVTEFKAICEDFNEMAWRLMESANSKLRDQENRKELIAGISHDLRTPLTSIKACAEGLEKGVAATPEKRLRYLNTIKTKINDLEKIIEQLFIFSKMDVRTFPLNLRRIDLRMFLNQILSHIQDEFSGAGLMLTLKKSPEPVMVNIDPALFQNALGNVFENSLKYKKNALGKVEISLEPGQGQILLRLTDDGPGVPEEELESIFEVFYRCDPARAETSSGSGLGLAITARIIQQLGGSLKAENAAGGGLSIVMTLPLSLDDDYEQEVSDDI